MQFNILRRAISSNSMAGSLRYCVKLTSSFSISRDPFLISKRKFTYETSKTTNLNCSKSPRNIALSSLFAKKTLIREYVSKIVKVPSLAESLTEGTLAKWNKKVGDFIQQDEEVATIETDKVDAPINSPYSGKIIEIYANEQDTVVVSQDLFKIELLEDGATTSPETDVPKPESQQESKPEPKEESKPEPKEELKPEPKQESKQEPKQESKQEPKQESKQEAIKEQLPSPPPTKSVQPEPRVTVSEISTSKAIKLDKVNDFISGREEREVKMTRMRARIAERLKEAQNTAASLTTFNEIDMSNIIELRNTYKDAILKKHGIKLGFMSAFVKASVVGLQEIPSVNASISSTGDTIIYRDYVDMSVAVATPKGLVTPVIRNTHLLSFLEIEKTIADLGKKARDGKMSIEDMAGGTFTISNGGVYGSLLGTPIINIPQSAILGMHATKERPVAINGKIEIRPMMYVALTYDHRLIDGREAVTFLKTIKEQVEDPRPKRKLYTSLNNQFARLQQNMLIMEQNIEITSEQIKSIQNFGIAHSSL
ncbi:2577_t:CDS:10 [Diversispora eburnea]|uniref:dihydrolipoyllysine-residue succinyltransferase n=1 Tax=Diversispora eburnea TaxID=1213867 RepID=A0A9N8WH41_9GLOM|nr:2577_t:CDS:10 [Diversispora eburnea]